MKMGIGVVGGSSACIKRKFRWIFTLSEVSDGGEDSSSSGLYALPPAKGSRPGLSFKEYEIQHMNETVYWPSKPDWKPITLTLYDMKRNTHPVFDWIKKIYNPKNGEWNGQYVEEYKKSGQGSASLKLYDGCGNVLETWVFENVWPQNVEFGDLDMASNEYCTVDLTLRYDRAYIIN